MSKIASNFCIFAILLLGISNAFKIQSRIYNGMPSDRGQHPFYVFLEIDQNNNNKQECGGTLIGDRFVVTAAHCVQRIQENIRLSFGVYETMNVTEEGRKTVTISRDDVIIHPLFASSSKRNDIAILKMRKPIEFSLNIQPVKFASDCELREFDDGVVVGVGYQGPDSRLSKYVQWAPLSIVSTEECNAVFPFLELHSRSGIFCVANQDVRSVCKGDSGSPLVHHYGREFIGIASFISGNGCENGAPQAFTKVSKYQNWIADVTGLELPHCGAHQDDYFLDYLINDEMDMYW